MSDIHFECPACGQPMSGNVALVNETIECPGCHDSFQPSMSSVQKVVEAAQQEKLRADAKTAEVKAVSRALGRAERIRSNADGLAVIALIFLAIGGIILFFDFINTLETSDEHPEWLTAVICASTCFGTAFWFYLIAQIMHIRANTEK